MHIKGFLARFSKTAKTQAEFLNRVAKLSVPLVGVDPAIVLSYRDEYKEALGDSRGNFHVLTAHEWLTNQLESNALQSAVKNIAKSDRTFGGIYSLIVLNPPLCQTAQKNGSIFLRNLDKH